MREDTEVTGKVPSRDSSMGCQSTMLEIINEFRKSYGSVNFQKALQGATEYEERFSVTRQRTSPVRLSHGEE